MQADMIHPREPSQSFAQSGVAVRLLRGPAPTRFQVLGERSSGTNLVKRLIMMNSDLEETELLGWKHGFPSMAAIPSDLLVVGRLVTRADDPMAALERVGLDIVDGMQREWT